MIAAWSRFWFAPGPIHVLGILRIVVILNAMISQIIPALQQLPAFASRPPALMHPTAFHVLTGLHWPPAPVATTWITWLAPIVGLCACLGLATRWSLLLFLGFYGYLAGGLSTLGAFDHIGVLIFHVIAVLIVAPGSTAWSIDALLAGRRAGRPLIPALRGADGERWGIQLILVLVAAVYLVSGIAKLRWGGLQWLDGRTLAWYLSGQAAHEFLPIMADPSATPATAWRDGVGLHDHAYFSRKSGLAAWIGAHQPLPMLLAIGAVAFELAAWLVLIPRLRNWILVTAVMFHTVVGQLMGQPFWDWRLVCLVLIDWPALVRAIDCVLQRLLPPSGTPGGTVVLFDGVCGLCDSTVSWVMAADRRARLRFAALQSTAADRLIGTQATRTVPDSIVVVQGARTMVRSTAILAICAELGGLWRLAAILRLVPRPLRDGVYALVARWRFALFGRRETCRMPTAAERARFID